MKKLQRWCAHAFRLNRILPKLAPSCRKTGELAERIGRRLNAGESLADAVEVECATMPAAYRATVVAGSQGGQLASAIESVVDSASRVEQLRRITGVALLYPMMVSIVAVVLMT